MTITEYFKDSEICCPCCGLSPIYSAVEKLYLMRMLLAKPVVINSGARCAAHNNTVGGAPASSHVYGYGFDTHVQDSNHRWSVVFAAMSVGFTRIIIHPTYIHIDNMCPLSILMIES